MKALIKNLKITRTKLFIAKILYYFVRIVYWNNKQKVKRHGINFELDLNEGIDLSLFIFGNFQKHIYNNKLLNFEEDSIIYDIGGNAGVMSLLFAQKSPKGFVHAFEPTDYALNKFRINLGLNPELKDRIKVTQCFISSESKNNHGLEAFSSWPINTSDKKHSIHMGVAKSTKNVPAITMDDYTKQNNVSRLDIIKIDTDGHEFDVLKGATETIKNLNPRIIFEIGIYIMDEKNIKYSDYEKYFSNLDYSLFTTKGKKIDSNNYTDLIPRWGTTDIIAVPN